MIFPPAWRFTVEDVAPPEAVTPATLPAELRGLGSRPADLPQMGRKNDLHAASHAGEPTRTRLEPAIRARRQETMLHDV
jgi:hypothetical protein